MRTSIKLFLIKFVSFIFGRNAFSKKIADWCYAKEKKIQVEKAKKTDAKWVVVIWEWKGHRYNFIPQKSEADVALCIRRNARIADHWFIETVTL